MSRKPQSTYKYLLLVTASLLVSLSITAPILSADDTADQKAKTSEKTAKPLKSGTPRTLSPQDQQSTMEFVREHHPELAHLLDQLQKSRPEEFQNAIRQLVPQVQSIQRLRERAPARYSTQLAAWKLDSEIRLLIARWARNPDPQIESQIRELVHQRQQSRQTELESEQKRLEEQLHKVNEQLQSFAADPVSRVEAEWQQLSKQATAAVRSTKSPKSDKIPNRPQPNARTNETK